MSILKTIKNIIVKNKLLITSLVLVAAFFIFGIHFFTSAEGQPWSFEIADDYMVSDASKIEIVDGMARLIAIDQTDDDNTISGFAGGTHDQTRWSSTGSSLELADSTSGVFTSRIMDAGSSASWQSIAWTPVAPYGKELPNDKGQETVYSAGNVDMSSNVLLMHMNETSGSISDSSGEGNNGTSHGSIAYGADGRYNNTLSFDGVDDYIEVANDFSLQIDNQITLETWVNFTEEFGEYTHSSDRTLIDKADYSLKFNHQSGKLEFELNDAQAVEWELVEDFDSTKTEIYDLERFNEKLYASTMGWGTSDGDIWSSVDGASWQLAHDFGNGVKCALDLSAYKRYLYASTGCDDGQGDLYRTDDGDNWELAHDFGPGYNYILEMFTFRDYLYAGLGREGDEGDFYRSGDGTNWELAEDFGPNVAYVQALSEYQGYMYAGTGWGNGDARIYRSDDGLEWQEVFHGSLDFSGVTDLVSFNGQLYVTLSGSGLTTGHGAIYRTNNGLDWTEIEDFDSQLIQAYTLRNYNGRLYVGVWPDTSTYYIYQSQDGENWLPVEDFDPFNIYRIDAFNDFKGSLYTATGFSYMTSETGRGKIYKYGNNQYLASDVNSWQADQWYHIAATYDGAEMRIYINGVSAGTLPISLQIETNSSPLCIGNNCGDEFFNGLIDEVAIYNTALSPIEVLYHYGRGVVRLKHQVRSCDDASCSGEEFMGPDGAVSTYYSELQNSGPGLPNLSLSGVQNNQYFQYKTLLETDDDHYLPELKSLTIGPGHFPGNRPTIRPDVHSAREYTQVDGFLTLESGSGSVAYQITNQGSLPDPIWYYWNGNAWIQAGDSEYNSAEEVDNNIDEFTQDIGQGDFSFRAFLISDTTEEPVLDHVSLAYSYINNPPYFGVDFTPPDGGYASPPTANMSVDVYDDDLSPGVTVGDINPDSTFPISTLQFEESTALDSDVIHISGNIYAIAYEGPGNNGFVKTVEITSEGQISDEPIASFEFDTSRGTYVDIIHISGNIYAIAYQGLDNDCFLKTIKINPNGQIDPGTALKDTFEFDDQYCRYPNIIHVSGKIYAIAYTDTNNDGMLKTVEIKASGQITKDVVAGLEFDAHSASYPDIIHVSDNIYAIVYEQTNPPNVVGVLKTVEISTDGQFPQGVVASVIYANKAKTPDIIHVAGNIFAIAYVDTNGWLGSLKTIEISDIGQLPQGVIDTSVFDDSFAIEPRIINISGNIYAIAYTTYLGLDTLGYLKIVDISAGGQMDSEDVVKDSLEFDSINGDLPKLINISGDTYAVVYTGPNNSGYIKTVEIASSGSGAGTLITSFYADSDPADLDASRVCVDEGLFSGDYAQCAWSAPVVQPEDDTLFMSHFNCDSGAEGADDLISGTDLLYDKIYSYFYVEDESNWGTCISETEVSKPRVYCQRDGDDCPPAYPICKGHIPRTSTQRFGKFVDGQVGSGLVFDNYNDYVQVPNDSSLSTDINAANALTMEAWVRPIGFGDCGMIVGNGGGWGKNGYHLMNIKKKKFRVEICNHTDGAGCMGALDTAAGVLEENEWGHIAVVYDGNTVKIYINGDEHVSKDWTGGVGISTADLGLGDGLYPSFNCPTINADIDEVRIYSRALSPEEIDESYSSGTAGARSGVSSQGLKLYLPFDETSGETAYDSSGNNNDGTLVNYIPPVYCDAEEGLGGAMRFDGTGGHFWWPTTVKPLPNGEEFSFAAWIKIDEDHLGRQQNIFSDYHTISGEAKRSFQWQILNDGNQYFWISNDCKLSGRSETGDADTAQISENNKITDTDWHYVVATYKYLKDGMSRMSTYVDGELTSWTYNNRGPLCRVGNTTSFIGAGRGGDYFKGYIDEPMILDRELSAEEIRENYSLGQGVYYWQAELTDGVHTVSTDVMDFKLNTLPEISLYGLEDGALVSDGIAPLGANASDIDGDDLRTSIHVALSLEELNQGQICNAYDTGTSSLSCEVTTLPVSTSDEDLVVYYKFDNDFYVNEEYELGGYDIPFDGQEVGCYNTYDYSGNEFEADQDCNHKQKKWRAGLVNQSLHFDNWNDYVEVSDDDSLDLSGQFSFDFWFRPEHTNTGDQIFNKPGEGNQYNYAFYYATTTLFCVNLSDGTAECARFSDDVFFLSEWNHVVALLDGSYLRVYVNGEEVASEEVSSPELLLSNKDLIIGNKFSGTLQGAKGYYGSLDEFHVYNRLLTEDEILQSLSDGLKRVTSTVSTSGQVLYLPFDHTSGDVASDHSGNGNDGSLKNFRYMEYMAGEGKYGGALDFHGSPSGITYGELLETKRDEDPNEFNSNFTGDLTLSAWVKPHGHNTSGNNIIFNRRYFQDPNQDSFDMGFLNHDENDVRLFFRVDENCQRDIDETTVGDFISYCSGGSLAGQGCDYGISDSCGEGGECLPAEDEKDEWIGEPMANIISAEDYDSWHHIAATYQYDETADLAEVTLYLNGEPVVRNTESVGPLCWVLDPIIPLQVGGYWPSGEWEYPSRAFNGAIDEAAVYKRALAEDEIARIYNNRFSERHYYWKAAVYDGLDIVESEVREFFVTGDPVVDEVIVEPISEFMCSNAVFPEFSAEISDPDLDDETYALFYLTRTADLSDNPITDESFVGTGSVAMLQGGKYISYCTEEEPVGAPCLDPSAMPGTWQDGLPEGVYSLTVQAIDAYGATSEWSEVYQFDVDRTAPEDVSLEIVEEVDEVVTLALSATDDHSDDMQIRVSGDVDIDDPATQEYLDWHAFETPITVKAISGVEGTIITVEFKDGCDNISEMSVGLGLHNPTVSIVSPKDDEYLAGDDDTYNNVTFEWEFSDDDTADSQTAYIIEIYSDEAKLNKIYPVSEVSEWVSSDSTNVEVVDLPLETGTRYFLSIKVQDSYGLASDWASESFYTNDRPGDLSIVFPVDYQEYDVDFLDDPRLEFTKAVDSDLIKYYVELYDYTSGEMVTTPLVEWSRVGLELNGMRTIVHESKSVDWSHELDILLTTRLEDDGYFDVYTMNLDGSQLTCLTCGKIEVTHKHMGNAAWYPSGEYIVFTAQKPEVPDEPLLDFFGIPGKGLNNDLWLMKADGSQFWPLHEVEFLRSGWNEKGVIHPQFSHDGSLLIWAERLGDEGDPDHHWGEWAIQLATFEMTAEGPEINVIDTIQPCEQNMFFETHAFSKDDKKIMFTANGAADQSPTDMDIYIYNIETEELERLTDPTDPAVAEFTIWDEHAHWSPDEREVAWMSSDGLDVSYPTGIDDWQDYLESEFWLMQADGSQKTRLTGFNIEGYPEYMDGRRVVVGDSAWDKTGDSMIMSIAYPDGVGEKLAHRDMLMVDMTKKKAGVVEENYKYDLSDYNFNPGEYRMRVCPRDYPGLSGECIETHFTIRSIDQADPVADIVSPIDDERLGGSDDTYNDVALVWTFSDDDYGDDQIAYQIEIYNEAGELVNQPEWVLSAEKYTTLSDLSIAVDSRYSWRVRVRDNYGRESDWSQSGYFYTNDQPEGLVGIFPEEAARYAYDFLDNPRAELYPASDSDPINYQIELNDELGEPVDSPQLVAPEGRGRISTGALIFEEEQLGFFNTYFDKAGVRFNRTDLLFQLDSNIETSIIDMSYQAFLANETKIAATRPDNLVYNPETWPTSTTPLIEQQDPVAAVVGMRELADRHRADLIVAPDRYILADHGPEIAQIADGILIQGQRFQKDDLQTFISEVEALIEPIRAAEPLVEILIQISTDYKLDNPDQTGRATAKKLFTYSQAIRDRADEVVILYDDPGWTVVQEHMKTLENYHREGLDASWDYYSYDLSSYEFNKGSYDLEVCSRDIYGLTGECYQTNFDIAASLPIATIISPKDERLYGNDATYNDIIFTWQFADEDIGDYQSAYRIEIYNTDEELVYDNGWVTSQSLTTTIEGLPLATGTEYYWKITVRDSFELEGESNLASFATNGRPYGVEILLPGDEGDLDIGDPRLKFTEAADPDSDSIEYKIELQVYGEEEESQYETLYDWGISGLEYAQGNYIFPFSYEFSDGDYSLRVCPRDQYELLGDCAETGFTVVAGRINRWPVAIIKPIGSVYSVDDSIFLDGSDSYDPDGDSLTYKWILLEKPLGSGVSLSDDSSPWLTLVPDEPGFYTVILEVTDNNPWPATSLRGLNCNYDDWACFQVVAVGVPSYCGDGFLQGGEQCEVIFNPEAEQWQVITDVEDCSWTDCQNCACRGELTPPDWKEVIPR